MKNSRIPVLLSVLAGATFASGASFVSDLSGLTPGSPGDDLAGYVDGGVAWTQSEANPAVDEPLAWGMQIGSTNAFGVGVAYGVPAAAEFDVSHAIDRGLAGAVMYTTLVITDSTTTWPDRNDYTVGLFTSGGDRLFSIDFQAVSGDASVSASNDQWNVHWSTGNTQSSGFAGALEDRTYKLSVEFVANGADVDFTLKIMGTNTVTVSDTLTGLALEDIGSYRVGTSVGSGTDWGDGFIAIGDVSVVPETSSAALVVLSALGLLRRRR